MGCQCPSGHPLCILGDLESYYQEAGAGRDGKTLVVPCSVRPRHYPTNVYLIEQSGDPIGRQKLNEMIDYCHYSMFAWERCYAILR